MDKHRLLDLISAKGYNHREFAIKVGITEVSLSRYISGTRTPRVDVLVRMADALGVTVDYLCAQDESDITYQQVCAYLDANAKKLSVEQKRHIVNLIII